MTTAIGPGSLPTSFIKVCLPSVGREDFVGDNFGLLPPEFQLALLFAAFWGKRSSLHRYHGTILRPSRRCRMAVQCSLSCQSAEPSTHCEAIASTPLGLTFFHTAEGQASAQHLRGLWKVGREAESAIPNDGECPQ
jgi:hypothetical protein